VPSMPPSSALSRPPLSETSREPTAKEARPVVVAVAVVRMLKESLPVMTLPNISGDCDCSVTRTAFGLGADGVKRDPGATAEFAT